MSEGVDWRRARTGFAGLLGPPLGWFLIGPLDAVSQTAARSLF